MNKRIGLISLFAITVVLLAMVGAITALAAPSSAQVAGTVTLDKKWYTIGSGVKITITDADENVKTPTSQSVTLDQTFTIGAAQFKILTLTGGAVIVGSPKILASGQTSCTTGTVDTNLTVAVANAVTGLVSIQNTNPIAGGAQTICFDTGQKDTVPVKITSTQDSTTGITVNATETDVDTGKFEVTITLVDAATTTAVSSDSAKTLRSLNGDTITATYSDCTPSTTTVKDCTATKVVKVTGAASVETGKPSFSGLAPAHPYNIQDGTNIVFSGTISDVGGSGLKVSTVKVFVNGNDETTRTVSGTDGDASVTFKLTKTLTAASNTWYAQATDVAGNTARSDAVPDVSTKPATIGDQDFTISIDTTKPTLSTADTGKYWDPVTKAVKSNKLTAVVVTFSEDLDGTTVQPADFTVEGVAPTAADIFADAGKSKVFLTLASAMAADAKPVVRVVGEIKDLAGNSLTTGVDAAAKTAADAIGPTFTIALDKTITKDKVVITATANEKVAGLPSIKAFDKNKVPVTLNTLVKTTTSWEATFDKSLGADGKYSVQVTGNDQASPANSGTTGKDDPATAGATVFTLDTTAPTITFDPKEGDSVTKTSLFITLTFNEKSTVTKAEFGEKGTTLKDVLTAGKLSSDGKSWSYSAAGLTVDKEYTISTVATDVAGNASTALTATFKVKATPLVEIALAPGQNLISLPGAPADPTINAVITSAEVKSVVTYDPANPDPATGSPWLTATRGADGKLSGSLKTIDAAHGYWVETTSFTPIKVNIPPQGFAALPPAVAVVAGWNLVPVVSISGDAPGTNISADTYLGSTKWVTAYTFDTAKSTWTKVLPKNFQNVVVGKGYWVYVTEKGILVP